MKTIFTENTTNYNVILDTNAKKNMTKMFNSAKSTYDVTVSPKTAVIHNELVKRFQDNNFCNVQLAMKKSGDVITVVGYRNDKNNSKTQPEKIEDLGWFEIHNGPCPIMISESLTEIASMIADYDKIVEEHRQEQQDLQRFYEEHIMGYGPAMLELGNDILSTMSGSGMKELDLEWAMDRWGESEEIIYEAATLAEDFNHYSNWYKSINGHRPRFFQ